MLVQVVLVVGVVVVVARTAVCMELVSRSPANSRRITAASACCSVGRLAKVVASCRVQAGVLEIIPDTLLGPRRLRAVVAVREPRKGVGSVTGSVPEGHSSATKSEFPDPNSKVTK